MNIEEDEVSKLLLTKFKWCHFCEFCHKYDTILVFLSSRPTSATLIYLWDQEIIGKSLLSKEKNERPQILYLTL